MQTNLSPFSSEDWHDIAEFRSSRPPARALTKFTSDKQIEEIGSTIASRYGCASYHGSDYRGKEDVPRLAGQLRNYLALHQGSNGIWAWGVSSRLLKNSAACGNEA